MKRCFFLLLLPITLVLLSACSEKEDPNPEYANWSTRNDAAFTDSLRLARTAMAQARSKWGDAWEEHCDWRVLRNYIKGPDAKADRYDSVVVHILQRGTGSGSPLSTDTVRVAYMGRLIPTKNFAAGYLFDHSGNSADSARVFDPLFAVTSKFAVQGVVPGFGTALQQMRIGDRWRLILPSRLAYGEVKVDQIPAHSTLVFDVELRSYERIH